MGGGYKGLQAALARRLTIYFAVVEKQDVAGGHTNALCHSGKYFGGGFLYAQLARQEYVFKKVCHVQTFVAEQCVLGHAPVYAVGIAQQAHVVVLLDFEQHVEAVGRHRVEITLPRCHKGFVGQVGMAAQATQFVAELVGGDAPLLKLAEYA